MPTLVLSPRHSADDQALWRAAVQEGWDVVRPVGWRFPEGTRIADPVVYMEPLMAPFIAQQIGVTIPELPNDWLPSLPEQHRRRKVRLATVADARKEPCPFFLKPPNDKSFAAFACESHSDIPGDLEDGQPVLISEVVRCEEEFRCFVADRQVVAASIYLKDGVLQKESGYECDEDDLKRAWDFAQSVCDDTHVWLPPGVVIDMGRLGDGSWAVVEANAAWGSGIYGCDPVEVLMVLRRASG